MAIKASSVYHLPVIETKTGKEISQVKDIVFDPEGKRVTAFLIDPKGWFSDARILLLSGVESIRPDSVIVASIAKIKRASQVGGRISSIASSTDYLSKTKIITEKGEALGRIVDLYFELEDGRVTAFMVSLGVQSLISDFQKLLPDEILVFGQDALIVKNSVKYTLQSKTVIPPKASSDILARQDLENV